MLLWQSSRVPLPPLQSHRQKREDRAWRIATGLLVSANGACSQRAKTIGRASLQVCCACLCRSSASPRLCGHSSFARRRTILRVGIPHEQPDARGLRESRLTRFTLGFTSAWSPLLRLRHGSCVVQVGGFATRWYFTGFMYRICRDNTRQA